MLVGVPREIKAHEYRVGLVPASVREPVNHGHTVIAQTNAGHGTGFDDAGYAVAGAANPAGRDQIYAPERKSGVGGNSGGGVVDVGGNQSDQKKKNRNRIKI